MKILVIGSGGREHALAWKLAQSPGATLVYSSVPAVDGDKIVYNTADLTSNEDVLEFCKEFSIDLVVIGPEAPLAEGMADALQANGVKVFGAVKAGARLEYSKEYSKRFMQKYAIPTAAYESFTDYPSARERAAKLKLPLVIKADGLAAGKGVRVCLKREEVEAALSDFMQDKTLGDSGSKVIFEEFLDGREASIMAFVGGDSYQIMPVSRDHKRLLDGDNGPNTGGMGVYSPVADITAEDIEFIKKNVFDNTLRGLKAEGINFCGIIYAGIMKGSKGIKVLEYNCRFGDPETQTILPLLENDLLEVILACIENRLKDVKISSKAGASVCVILAGKDYPAAPSKGLEITGLGNIENALVFHSGTKTEKGKIFTSGGRVLGVVGVDKDIARARAAAYAAAKQIHFEGVQYRSDIGGNL